MVDKLNERRKQEIEAIKGKKLTGVEQVSDTDLLAHMGIKVKHGD